MANVTTRIEHDGYGMLELNQVAFRRDGRIEAQCKLKAYDASTATNGFDAEHPAENGMLLTIDAANRQIVHPADATAKVALNYTTEHMYDERHPELKNFYLVPGTFLPRMGYLTIGDKFTTNTVCYAKGDTYATEAAFWTAVEACGTTPMYGCPDASGAIFVSTSATNAVLQVVKKTTMADGQKAIQFIAL